MDDYDDSFEQTSSSSSGSSTVEAESFRTTPPSSMPEVLGSVPASQTFGAPDPELASSTNDARIEATTSDLAQELPQHSFLARGSTMSSTEFISTHGDLSERKRAAIDAASQPKFQFLSNFKAFSSISPTPTETSFAEDGLARTPKHLSKDASPSGVKVSSVAKASVTTSGSKQDSKRRLAKKDASFPEENSSIFSTLSQHLKATTQPPAVVAAMPLPCDASPPAQAVDRVITLDSPVTPHPVVEVATEEREITKEKATTKESETTVERGAANTLLTTTGGGGGGGERGEYPSLPHLPPSSLSVKSTTAAPRVWGGATATMREERLMSTAPEMVPPLPPPRVVALSPETQPFTIDPKLLELRETSEAVERLVKAFVLLRGQLVEDSTPAPAAFQSSAKETLSSTAFHKVCGDATVRSVSTRALTQPYGAVASSPAQHPPPPTPSLSKDEIAALKVNEANVEETLMVCVLEMLQRDLAKPQRMQRLVDSLKARPPHEIITADEFKANAVSFGSKIAATASGAANGLPHRDIYSVFDSDMHAFNSGDEDAASVLFNSIQDGIHKYVFYHVVGSTTTKKQTVSPITPHFSWILLLDLLAVCEEILTLGFGEYDTPTMGPLLVRYDGDPDSEFIARNAIQCLPFEPLEMIGRSKGSKPVFRLEFWVTKEKMQVIMAAITDCVRQHIVHEARVRPYMALLEDEDEIHPSVLAPSKVPLFSFVRPDVLGNATRTAAKDAATSYRQGRDPCNDGMRKRATLKPSNAEERENMFGVDQKGLQKMAYAVSVISTDALASFTSSERGKAPSASSAFRDPADYEDLSKAVAETVCELMEDTAVKASIERRARDKFVKMLKEKKEYPGKDRLERERLVIERAEREAEDMIKRIVQQMSLRASGK